MLPVEKAKSDVSEAMVFLVECFASWFGGILKNLHDCCSKACVG